MSAMMQAKKSPKSIERISVTENLKFKLQTLCQQANEALNGIASISKSDIANLLIERHPGILSKDEMEHLRQTHFDEVRFANWMAKQLKDARNKGESISLMELVQQKKNLLDPRTESSAHRVRKQRKKDRAEESLSSSAPNGIEN